MESYDAPMYVDFDNASFLSTNDESFFNLTHTEHEQRRFDEFRNPDFDDCDKTISSSGEAFDACRTPTSNRSAVERTDSSGGSLSNAMSKLQIASEKKQQPRRSTRNALRRVQAAIDAEVSFTRSGKKKRHGGADVETLARRSMANEKENGNAAREEKVNAGIESPTRRSLANRKKNSENTRASSMHSMTEEKGAGEDAENAQILLMHSERIEEKNNKTEEIKVDVDDIKIFEHKDDIQIVAGGNDATCMDRGSEQSDVITSSAKEDSETTNEEDEAETVGAEGVAIEPIAPTVVEKQATQKITGTLGRDRSAGSVLKATVVASVKNRRQSIVKPRRRSTKFVSLAEAISKFQYGTPQRFRSTKTLESKPGALEKIKPTTAKLTCPQSPALRCRSRARAAAESKVENRETLRIGATTKNRPQPVRAISAPAVARKTTVSQMRKKMPPTTERKIDPKPGTATVIPRPAKRPATNPQSIVNKSEVSAVEAVAALTATVGTCFLRTPGKSANPASESFVARKTPGKTLIPSVVSVDEKDVVLKDVEINYFGIPIDAHYKKNITRPIPFSFETRNKESQSKKNLQKSQESLDGRSRQSIFRARPAPLFTKPGTSAVNKATATSRQENSSQRHEMCPPIVKNQQELPKKLSVAVDAKKIPENRGPDDGKTRKSLIPTRPAPSSSSSSAQSSTKIKPKEDRFQQHTELLIAKKQKKLEELAEIEKKARVFHAKPAPTFKPVFVRGVSSENLRSKSGDRNAGNRPTRGVSSENLRGESRDRNSGKTTTRELSKAQSQESIGNRENKAPNVDAAADNPRFPKIKEPLLSQNAKIHKI